MRDYCSTAYRNQHQREHDSCCLMDACIIIATFYRTYVLDCFLTLSLPAGDSITYHWQDGMSGGKGRELERDGLYYPLLSLYTNFARDMNAINLGITSDGVEHLLWRILNGAFPAGLRPQVVNIMIGVNNLALSRKYGPKSTLEVNPCPNKFIMTMNSTLVLESNMQNLSSNSSSFLELGSTTG